MPQTLIAIPAYCALRCQIFSSQGMVGRRSKMTSHSRRGQGQPRGAAPYMPQTLIAIPACCALRCQIFSSQGMVGRRSKMTRCASSAPVASA